MNFRSSINHLYLLIAKRPLPLEKPKVIQFPVIDICNSACQMCRIWENKKSVDISVDDLKKGLSNGLFSEVESIGFNGGEPTLRKDLTDLVQVVVDSLPKLKGVSLITNAFKYRQVIEQIEAMGKVLGPHQINFDVMVSLDGYGDVHDRVRGREGNFNNAQLVIDYIKSSPLINNVRIGCTVIRENVYALPDLLDFCIRNDLYVKYRQGVPHQRLYTENLKDPYALLLEEKYEFVEFLEGLIKHYEPNLMQRFFYRSLIEQIIHHAPRRAGCAWQHMGATITARGELAYCAVKSKVISPNIAEGNPMEAYFGNKEHLTSIIKNDCDECHHDYVGIPGKSDSRRIFLLKLEDRFRLKSKIKQLPGFDFLNDFRSKRNFNGMLAHYRALSQNQLNDRYANYLSQDKRVLLCGWYGTETLGDKAIIAGIMTEMRNSLGAETKFSVASLNPYITQITSSQMPEFDGTDILNISEAVITSATYDYVVFAGGPMMAIKELAPIEVIFERAKAAGRTTIAAGVGIGPLGPSWLNQSICRILQHCDTRIYRDEKSRQSSFELGIKAQHDLVAEDPAFTWLRGLSDKNKTSTLRKTKVLLLGLRDFPYQNYATDLSEKQCLQLKRNYEQVIVDTIRQLISKNPDLVVRPLPMCTNHFGDDDRWFYRGLFRDANLNISNLDYSLLGPEQAPESYVRAFQDADVVLAMRFHSLVFGIESGANCVAIDYTMGHGKVHSLAKEYNVPMLSMRELESGKLAGLLTTELNKPRQQKINKNVLRFSSTLDLALRGTQSSLKEAVI